MASSPRPPVPPRPGQSPAPSPTPSPQPSPRVPARKGESRSPVTSPQPSPRAPPRKDKDEVAVVRKEEQVENAIRFAPIEKTHGSPLGAKRAPAPPLRTDAPAVPPRTDSPSTSSTSSPALPLRPNRALPSPPSEQQRVPPFRPPLDPVVKELLECLNLAKFAPYFEVEEIDAVALLLMRDEDVAELIIPDKTLLLDALRCVPWSSVTPPVLPAESVEPYRGILSEEVAATVRRILRRPDSDSKWTRLCEMFEQLSSKLSTLESVYGVPLQRMLLEPNSGVTSRVVETLVFRVPIMLSLSREFAETRDLHVGQTLLNLLVLYLRNCETASVMYHSFLIENPRFAATLQDIERDNGGAPFEHLAMYPVYFAVALPRAVEAIVQAHADHPPAALERFASLAASVETEGHAAGRGLRAQEDVRAMERRLANRTGPSLAAVGRRLLHEGSLMAVSRGKLEQFHAFLLSDVLLLTTQNSDNLQFRVRECINLLDGPSDNPALCLERVVDEFGDFGVKLKFVHNAGTGNDAGLKMYASSQAELDEWISRGLQAVVAFSLNARPRSPNSSANKKKKSAGQVAGAALLAKLRSKGTSSPGSPRAGLAGLFNKE